MAGRQDESVLRSKLRELSNYEGVLRTNLYDFLSQELRARWHITSDDLPVIVLAKVIWQLERLISELEKAEHRIAARYSYNLTGIEAVEDMDLGERQKQPGKRREPPHPGDKSCRNYMTNVILPALETSLLATRAPAVPQDLLNVVAERAATGERVPAIMRDLLDGEPSEPRHEEPAAPQQLPRRRRSRLVPIFVGAVVVAVLVVGAGLIIRLASDDGDATDGPPNDPAAASDASTPTSAEPVVSGETFAEVCGNRNGCRVFNDPYTPGRTQPDLAFMQEVEVSCRVYSPSLDSVEWWYRLASEPHNNEWWSPAVTFLNGDPVEGPYLNHVDEAVPEC